MGGARGAGLDNIVISPGPGAPSTSATSASRGTCCGEPSCRCSASASAIRGSPTYGGAIDHAPEPMHGRLERGPSRRARPVRRHPAGLRGRALPLARRRRGAADAAGDGVDARRRRHGARAPRAAAVGRAVSPRVDLAPSTAPRCCATSATSRTRGAAPDAARRAPAGRPARRLAVHHRTLATWCDPERPSSRSTATASTPSGSTARARSPGWRASRSWARPTARSARSCATTSRRGCSPSTRRRARGAARERPRLPRARARRLRADAPELPFDFICGCVGYLGYELKAECGGDARHRWPQPDAALVFADRLSRSTTTSATSTCSRSPRRPAPAPPSVADGDRAPARGARRRRRRRAAAPGALRSRPRRPRRLPRPHRRVPAEIVAGETYEVCLTTELRSDGAIDPWRLPRAAPPQPGAVRRVPALRRLSVLSSSPERFLRVDADGSSSPSRSRAPRRARATPPRTRRAAALPPTTRTAPRT